VMYEEPYKWVEAVGNRRHYLDEQFRRGSPVVAASYADGIVLVTYTRGTPKLYEIYDRLAVGGMGHPADLEKLRFTLLEMAHVEGFNRSPSDVTGSRLLKNGLAPIVKQAFEEIYKAPFIVKILLAELGLKAGRDIFLTMNYDGTFEELTGWAVLAASPSVQSSMHAWLRQHGHFNQGSLSQVLSIALLAWGVGSLAQREEEQTGTASDTAVSVNVTADVQPVVPERDVVLKHVRQAATDLSIECAVLSRTASGPSKYRALKPNELPELLSLDLNPATNR
ncbi:MAG: hypothetical protein ACREIM_04915, partial [Nitrospiraceae bacterium]